MSGTVLLTMLLSTCTWQQAHQVGQTIEHVALSQRAIIHAVVSVETVRLVQAHPEVAPALLTWAQAIQQSTQGAVDMTHLSPALVDTLAQAYLPPDVDLLLQAFIPVLLEASTQALQTVEPPPGGLVLLLSDVAGWIREAAQRHS